MNCTNKTKLNFSNKSNYQTTAKKFTRMAVSV